MTKPQLDTTFLASCVTAVEDYGLGPVHANGAGLFLVEALTLQLQLCQLLGDVLALVLRHLSRLALRVQDDVHLLLNGFPALASLPMHAAIATCILMMTWLELDVRRGILAETASLQLCSQGLLE